MILDKENNGGMLVQKTRHSTLKLALAFSLKLQKSWKLLKKKKWALANLGRLHSCHNFIQDLLNSFHEAFLGKFDLKNGIGCKLASVGPRKLIKKINNFILSLGMGFYYSNTPS